MIKTTIQPYLFFDGNCREAMEFYSGILEGEVGYMTWANSPMEVPPEHASRIMHATLTVGDAFLFASDTMPGTPLEEGMRAQLCVGTEDSETGGKYFAALAEGGTVTMPYEEQFWGATFGTLTDRFGVKWMINAETKA